MRRTITILVLAVLISGCAIVADRRVAAGCQVADGLTTYYALTHGATELNPLFAGANPAFILLFKLALAYAVYTAFPKYEEMDKGQKFLATTVTVFGCIPAINNLNVIGELP